VVVTTVHGDQGIFKSASQQQLMEEIRDTYEKQGFRPDTIRQMMSNFRQACDGMTDKHCKDYLRDSLQKIKSARYTN
jgi:hypothetical protein